ncbi:MAG: histidinol-phosphatase HisJ family protein [Oscillospiraceae bacterium]|jgi:histidinol-phosphatase (PHP family)|nr:histidinol-phosphatase HisJ family protein [Oscillospiraceae bacterium]
MRLSNFHAHTTYADGANTAEEMVLAAIAKGLVEFGISEHGHTSISWDDYNMTPESMPLYFAEMRGLQAKYAGQIELFCGVEQDAYGDLPTDGADYIIGSTHFIESRGEFLIVDNGAAGQLESVNAHFGGDFIAFAEAYFAAEANIARITKCDIVGHFDLVNKNNERDRLFDTAHPRYRAAALTAMEEILKTCRLFEINTGAMYRVGRSEQYPQDWLLRELRARGGEVILSSDSHDCDSIGFRFAEMEELLRVCGFKSRKTLTRDGFIDIPL